MVHTLEEIRVGKNKFSEEVKESPKAHKKDATSDVKKFIVE